MPELGPMDQTGAGRLFALAPATQLAEDKARAVLVDTLADEWRSVAAFTSLRPSDPLVDSPTQKRQLEVGNASVGCLHERGFVASCE